MHPLLIRVPSTTACSTRYSRIRIASLACALAFSPFVRASDARITGRDFEDLIVWSVDAEGSLQMRDSVPVSPQDRCTRFVKDHSAATHGARRWLRL
jgi:hypothetical protein